MNEDALSELLEIRQATVEKYTITHAQKLPRASHYYGSFPPMVHRLTIKGIKYTFMAVGNTPWVKDGDTVSFRYRIKGKYRNIRVSSVEVRDADGQPVVRGLRRSPKKPTSETAE